MLFFCVQLALLAPIPILLRVVADLAYLLGEGRLWTRPGAMFGTHAVLRLALAAAGCGVGVWLWLRRPGAVRIVRIHLIGIAGAHLAFILLPYVFALPADVGSNVARALALQAVVLIPGTLFWIAYFAHSKRVRATYGAPPRRP